jgi:hypothetical protein
VEFLELIQIRAWAKEHGLECGPNSEVRRTGHERAASGEFVARLGHWDECLVWVKEWGVFPSGEDWPAFYSWRGAQNERRSLDKAPGHRFVRDEIEKLTQLVTLIMENAWDADVLCSRAGNANRLWGTISHNEICEIFALEKLVARS